MQALALKYRPKNFNELIGQEAVSKSLSHALNEKRLGHAYLFSGLRGSGKTSSARIFSKALVCEHGPTSLPCEQCSHCQMANESRHMDIIEMDAASHRGIDDIKEIIEQTRYAPASARFKIFIIDEVHMLSTPAFNALLKTLEEPPSYVKFILATTDPLKLPATVLSRTQHFRFKQIGKNAIVKHLEFILSRENILYEKEALEILARSGSGSLRDTLTLLDQSIIFSSANITKSSVASMLGLLDPSRIEELLETILSSDRARLKELIAEFESYEPEMIIDELIANLKDKFLTSDPRYSLLLCERFFRILAQSKAMLNTTSDNSFILSIMFFMMIEALNLKSIDEAIAQQNSDKNTVSASKKNSQFSQIQSPSVSVQKSPYEIFLEKIYDRNYNLGECFEKNIKFVSFENSILMLSSNASGDDQNLLRHSSKVIMEILKSVFGSGANIKITAEKKLQINEKSKFDEIENELQRLNLKSNQNFQKPANSLNIKESIQSLNANKSEEELEKMRIDGIIKEATALFGQPKLE